MRGAAVGVIATAVVLLSGCSAFQPAGGPRSASYATLAAFKTAYVAAGGTCPVWIEDDDIRAAAQSGTCGDGSTLSTYLDAADLLGEVKLMRDTASDGDDGGGDARRTELLLGTNWLVSGTHVRQLQPRLGGRLVVINPSASG